jgi:hypothetical protein
MLASWQDADESNIGELVRGVTEFDVLPRYPFEQLLV